MKKQKINCNVETCKYQNVDEDVCTLDSILVDESNHDDNCSVECEETCCASFEVDDDKLNDAYNDEE